MLLDNIFGGEGKGVSEVESLEGSSYLMKTVIFALLDFSLHDLYDYCP